MAKTLILVRHAKSDWGDPSLSDFDRPLNERGKNDAPVMAQRLVDKKIRIDAFISSPAKRAKKTAQVFAKAFDDKKENIIFHDELYLAAPEIFRKVIAAADNKYDCIAVFAHNPGITDFANELTNARVDNIPTCGVFIAKADCKKWKDFMEAEKEFLGFDYPKRVS